MNRRMHGFTLPEVLATLVVVGLVLPLVMQGVSLAIGVTSDAKQRAEAATLAEAKLYELAMDASSNQNGSGDFGADWPGYRWESSRTSAEDSMVELSVTVSWEHRGQPRDFVLTTWVRSAQAGVLP